MRKIITILLVLAFSNVQAQYKKASFFSKAGRTFALGGTSRFFGGGIGSARGFNISHGKEKSGKKIFHWWDLEYVNGNNYISNYTTQMFNGTTYVPITTFKISKSSSTLGYRYNFAYFVTKEDEKKIRPFIFGSLNYLIGLGGRFNDNSSEQGNVLGGIGAGGIYKIKQLLGLKFTTAYNISPANFISSNGIRFETVEIPNHLSINIGIRWLIDKDED